MLDFDDIFKWELPIKIGGQSLQTRPPTPVDTVAVKRFADVKELDEEQLGELRTIAGNLFDPKADASAWRQEVCLGVLQAVFEHFKVTSSKNSRSISQAVAGGGVEKTSTPGS